MTESEATKTRAAQREAREVEARCQKWLYGWIRNFMVVERPGWGEFDARVLATRFATLAMDCPREWEMAWTYGDDNHLQVFISNRGVICTPAISWESEPVPVADQQRVLDFYNARMPEYDKFVGVADDWALPTLALLQGDRTVFTPDGKWEIVDGMLRCSSMPADMTPPWAAAE